MPQISIIKKSDIQEAHRFDAEFFKPEYLEIEEIIKRNNHELFKNLIDDISSGENLLQNKKGKYKFIRNKNLDEILIEDSDISFTDIKGVNMTKEGDLIFSRVGNVGKNSIIFKDYENNNVSDNIVKIRISKINSFYLSVFFNSNLGKKYLKRVSKGSVQSLISIDNFNNIKIPILPQSFQLQIEKIVKSAHEKQTQSKQLYKEAEEVLLQEVDLLGYSPEQILSYETTKKETDEAERFDAEYFQPKYEKIIKKIEKYKNGWDFVKNIVNWEKGIEVGSETYQQDGMSFGRVSDFSINGVEKTGKKISKGLYQELKKDYQPKRNDILFTKDGTIGLSYVVKEEFELILSGAFLRLSLKEKYQSFEKECLSLIFNSIISKMQVEKLSGGAIIAHLKPSDFEKFKIPLIKPQVQKLIAEKIKESHKLRKESKELLEEAKRKVEEEIEK